MFLFFSLFVFFGVEGGGEKIKKVMIQKKTKNSLFLFPLPLDLSIPSSSKPVFPFRQVGSTQSVIIVLDNWEAKVVGWGPTPVYRAPPVGFTFSWGFYEYLWYANTYGSWGWKSPPLSLVMYDNWCVTG